MAQRILRPMEYGQILNEVFDLYKANFILLAGICGLIYLPASLIVYSTGNEIAMTLGGILLLPLHYVVIAAATWAISQRYLGGDVTIASSYRLIARRAFSFLFPTLLVSGLLVILGFICFIVPGVLLSFSYTFISQVFVVEGYSGSAARRRSKELATGQRLRIFVLGILTSLITGVITSMLTSPVQIFMMIDASRGTESSSLLYILMGLTQGLAYTLVTPISVIAFVLLYYDIRVRKEGFDLELLAASMGQKPAEEALTVTETTPV